MKIGRREYENLIRPLVESTLDSVSQALREAGRQAGDMDAILVVGDSTRTPLVTDMLIAQTGIEKAQAIAAHASPRTTKLYDRTSDVPTLEEIEKIGI